WPGPDDTMLRFVSRSIDLLEETATESGNAFRMNRRGYLFATADDAQVERLESVAQQVSAFGMGPLRTHPGNAPYHSAPGDGFANQPIGADLLLGDEALRAFPYLAKDTAAALHIRRAGFVNAVALGSWLLKRALAGGASFVRDRVQAVRTDGGRVREVHLASGDVISTEKFVIAAGPALPDVARMLDLELPVTHELHAKMTFRDTRGVVRRDAPFIIWTDPMDLEWSDEDREELARQEETRRLIEPLPGGVHVRPVDLSSGDELYLIWTFESDARPYSWPPTFNPRYADVLLRGCARAIPGMAPYVSDHARGHVDGGYYCKTRENRPLVGPLPIAGAFVLGALSGFGVMAAHAAGELLAIHVAEDTLPEYARWFAPSRYEDAKYRALIESWGPLVGQL
ncbi:MAG TPA: FAD-dependent oxidoreductase, partial [Gemmatimonadaceae bacterium]|nr:FAD-dependent oxidoreductase [Gemmatimonadaceae bacterium]